MYLITYNIFTAIFLDLPDVRFENFVKGVSNKYMMPIVNIIVHLKVALNKLLKDCNEVIQLLKNLKYSPGSIGY